MTLLRHPESDGYWHGTFTDADAAQGVAPVTPSDIPAGQRIPLAAGGSLIRASLDFETYSEAGYRLTPELKVQGVKKKGKGWEGGLGVVGTPNYAEHHSTEVLTLSYDLKEGGGVRRWKPGEANPADLLHYSQLGGNLAAWNITFEWYIWNLVCTRRYGWPPLTLEQCWCDMAKARRYALPGALDVAARVTGGPPKDPEGHKLVRTLTRPHTPTKKRPLPRWTRAAFPEEFAKLDVYCDRDVIAEDNVASKTPELTPEEREVWLVDQRINARGVQVDIQALDDCIAVLAMVEERFTAELQHMTGGAVGSVSEVAKLGDWLAGQGCGLPNMQAETVTDALKGEHGPLNPRTRRALEIRDKLASSNIKKLRVIALQVSSDGRLRDQYAYCGAMATARWSAPGAQLQNMTAKGPELGECESCGELFGWIDDAPGCPRCGAGGHVVRKAGKWEGTLAERAVERALADFATRSLDHILRCWPDPIAALCGCLRGLFIAAEGKELICVDFTAIEAVVLACLARCLWRIQVFESGRSIYLESASKITGTSYEAYEAYKQQTGSHHPDRNKLGKVMELACGFVGWIGAAKNFGADEHMTDEEIKEAIKAWRRASPEIVEFWGGQYRLVDEERWTWVADMHGVEGAAVQAVMFPGQPFEVPGCDVTYVVHDDVLWCVLPSGRRLYYHRPRLDMTEDRLGRGPYWSLSVEQYNTNASKGPVGWHRFELWVGILVENIVQAIARDLQAGAMVRVEAAGYPIVMHTHDELTAEVAAGWGSVRHMVELMIERSQWGIWWPIKAAGWRGPRFKKD